MVLLFDMVHRFYQGVFLLSKCHTALQYTCKCYYIYVHEKRTPFTALISIKLANPGQCYMQMSHIKFHPIWKINMETTNRNPFTLLNKYGVHFTDFHVTQNHPHCCGRLVYRMLFKSDEKVHDGIKFHLRP
jgi:hypothetical protein